MGGLPSDPIFGDLALRLAPRVLFSVQNEPGQGALADAVTWAYIEFRRERLTRDETAAMVGQDGLFYREFRRGEREVTHVHALVHHLRACAAEHPTLAVLLAAHDARARPPAAPRVVGVVNVTPDSFSDGGSFLEPARAIEHGLQLVAQGADLLDIGGESMRPGSRPTDAQEELRRVLPVVRGLAERTRVPLSIDTTKSLVARECLAAGATIVNDVSAGRSDPAILEVTARASAGYVAMHMLGTPADMQADPRYDDVTAEVAEFLRARGRAALEAGIERALLWVDPGIGFGKTLEHNLALLDELGQLRSLGCPVLLGASRKSFIAAVEDRAGERRSPAHERLGGSLAALALGVRNGADLVRVHDVRASKQAALVAHAIATRRA